MFSNEKLNSWKTVIILLLILIPIIAIIVALLLMNKGSKNEIIIDKT